MIFDPNNLFYKMVQFYQEYSGKIDPETNRPALVKILNQGSSRSSKTYDAIHFIVKFFDSNRGKKLYCGVFRNTLVDCRQYTFKDFVECLQIMDLYDECDVVSHPKPKITLWGNTIEFLGVPELNKQAPRTDILFFNETLEIDDKKRIDGLLMRCEKVAIFDWNPSYTQHWAFDMKNQFATLYTETTYRNNKHLPPQVISSIEEKCPWDFSDYDENKRAWKVPKEERKPNQKNIDAGTVDEWWWTVYGEGASCPQEGAIFKDVKWIDEFPQTGLDDIVFGLDFGYTNDPSVLVRVGREGMNLYLEYMVYQSTENVDILFDLVQPMLDIEEERRKKESYIDRGQIVVRCDSADSNHAGEDGSKNMVRLLNTRAYMANRDWGFVKTRKLSIVVGINIMKRFKIHVVENESARIEFENYVTKIVEGRNTNIPVDKFNHGIDAARYAIVDNFKWIIDEQIMNGAI